MELFHPPVEDNREDKNNIENMNKESLVALARDIENASTEEEMREYINKFLDSFSEIFHVKFSPDVTSLYRAMEEEKLLVRLERISAVMDDLILKKPIRLGEAAEDHYANAVIPNNEGIKIALSEGMAPGPIRLLLGFDVRSAIGFEPGNLEVSDIDVSEFDLRDTSLRSTLCRHVKGDLLPQQIKYLILRLPSHLVDDEHLTDKELEGDSPFVFRGARVGDVDLVN